MLLSHETPKHISLHTFIFHKPRSSCFPPNGLTRFMPHPSLSQILSNPNSLYSMQSFHSNLHTRVQNRMQKSGRFTCEFIVFPHLSLDFPSPMDATPTSRKPSLTLAVVYTLHEHIVRTNSQFTCGFIEFPYSSMKMATFVPSEMKATPRFSRSCRSRDDTRIVRMKTHHFMQ